MAADRQEQGAGKGVLRRAAVALDLPPDVVLDLPKVTVTGDLQVLVENHKGLLEYTSQRVRVRTGIGELVITGLRLTIGSILPEELVVDGRIAHVEFRR